MGYAIMRTEKIKGAGNRASSIAHAYRERETPNADLSRTPDNEVLVQYDKEKCDHDIESGRTRKDNVEVVDIVLTTSPDWMENATPEQKEEWQEKSMEWLKEEFGEENIQSAVLHKDEQTDHIQAHVTPRHEGKLNAGHWLDGKKKCQELQDRYHAKVKDLGLERGERGSKARHQEVSKYYARIEKTLDSLGRTDEVKASPVPEKGSGLMGGYTKDDLKNYGIKSAVYVRDQMHEREKTLIAKVVELEHELKANKGNIVKNQQLEKEHEKFKAYKNFYNDAQELMKINPGVKVELKKALEMKREREEQEWLKKSPLERMNELDKLIRKEKSPEKMKNLISKREKASDDYSKQIREQFDRGRNEDNGLSL